MKTRSGFLTFCFSFIPGAGQMYQGYMKRGLSLVGLFCFMIWLSSMVSTIAVLLPIVWMYSFFDTFNLRSQLAMSTAPADGYLLNLGNDISLSKLIATRHHLIGWALVALGVYALYENFVRTLLWHMSGVWYLEWLADILRALPTLALCVGLIWLGLWLVRGPQSVRRSIEMGGRNAAPEEDIHYYGSAGEEGEENDG